MYREYDNYLWHISAVSFVQPFSLLAEEIALELKKSPFNRFIEAKSKLHVSAQLKRLLIKMRLTYLIHVVNFFLIVFLFEEV